VGQHDLHQAVQLVGRLVHGRAAGGGGGVAAGVGGGRRRRGRGGHRRRLAAALPAHRVRAAVRGGGLQLQPRHALQLEDVLPAALRVAVRVAVALLLLLPGANVHDVLPPAPGRFCVVVVVVV